MITSSSIVHMVLTCVAGAPVPELKVAALQQVAKKGEPPAVIWQSPQSGVQATRDVTVQATVSVRDVGLGCVS